jgi:uroporphyrinogen-III synthase
VSAAVLILRPEPGASETAGKARRLGLHPHVAPLFAVRALAWEPPDPRDFDALLLTSANAARHGGAGLRRFAHLPCYAVGEATAEAARRAGFRDVRTGPADGEAAVAMIARDGAARVLHLCGRERVALTPAAFSIARHPVYAADPVAALPEEAAEAIATGALVLVHSPRAGALLRELVAEQAGIRLAAISPAAAAAAGDGWREKAVAGAPRDEALLELAAKLCQTEGTDGAGAGA